MTSDEALKELIDRVDRMIDWLDYDFSADEIRVAIKKLRFVRVQHLIAIQKEERGDEG
jgi:hypothetical protein